MRLFVEQVTELTGIYHRGYQHGTWVSHFVLALADVIDARLELREEL